MGQLPLDLQTNHSSNAHHPTPSTTLQSPPKGTKMQVKIPPEKLVVDYSIRELCPKSYPNHKLGCPNFGKRPTCPPRSPFLEDAYDLSKSFWVVWIEFNIGVHISRMARKHPEWSQRQKECCLYWQGTANRLLKDAVVDIEYYLNGTGNWKTTFCPEAMGVNVTATMKNIGVELEWPPQNIVRKVALIGIRKEPK